MTLREITVKRIAPGEMPSILGFQLRYIYHTEPEKFAAIFDEKRQLLYVNHAVPEDDVHKFVECASYPEMNINDPDCPVAETMDYVLEAYGASVYRILMEAHRSRRHMIADARAKERAGDIIPLIRREIDLSVEGNAPDIFDEELVCCISAAGNAEEYKTARNLVGYGTKYVFYLGYLMGAGRIKS